MSNCWKSFMVNDMIHLCDRALGHEGICVCNKDKVNSDGSSYAGAPDGTYEQEIKARAKFNEEHKAKPVEKKNTSQKGLL